MGAATVATSAATNSHVVAVTDHPFLDLEPTREVLAPLGVEIRMSASVGAADVLAVAREADAVINTYAQLPAERLSLLTHEAAERD